MTTLHRLHKALFTYTPTTSSDKSLSAATRSSNFLAVCHYLCKAPVDLVNPRHNRVSCRRIRIGETTTAYRKLVRRHMGSRLRGEIDI